MKLNALEKQENKLRRMFERHFINYDLNFMLANDPIHLYNLKNQYIGKREYYISEKTELMFLAYQAGYYKGRK